MKKFRAFYYYQEEDFYYLYFYKLNKSIKIDSENIELFNDVLNGIKCYDEFYSDIVKSFNIKERERKEEAFIKNKPKAFLLEITNSCNLRCKYCYKDEPDNNIKIMNFNDIEKIANYIIKNSDYQSQINIIFFGGEPLLGFKFIKEFINKFELMLEKSNIINKNVNYSITTNGVLINKEIADYLKLKNFTIQISIDGDEQATNFKRLNKLGQGAYNDILNGLKFIDKNINLLARVTITDTNLNLLDNFKYLYSLGFCSIAQSEAFNMLNYENIEILLKNYDDYLEYFKEMLFNDNIYEALAMRDVIILLYKIHYGEVQLFNCGAITNLLAIGVDGDIYPCQRFINNNNYNIGNLNKLEIDYKKCISICKEFKECENCICYSTCAGGCFFNNEIYNSSLNKPFYVDCMIKKFIFEKSLKIYNKLTDIHKRKIFN